jgi:hypothetical protein
MKYEIKKTSEFGQWGICVRGSNKWLDVFYADKRDAQAHCDRLNNEPK